MNRIKSLKLLTFSLFLLVFISLLTKNSRASSESVPQFSTCESKIFSSNGDRAHYDFGVHGIPGDGNMEGKDDVYTLSDANFLQCFCPSVGVSGIQSNWWNAKNLSESEVAHFSSSGWMFASSGLGWGLTDDPYLISNRDFSCSIPSITPTPHPSLTPTLVPTATPAPLIATSTPGPNGPISKCYDLEATPLEGSAPLTVRFDAHADDPATQGKIKQYRFDFADASGNQPQVVFQDGSTAYHRYEMSGEFEATLRIQDNAGNWRESDDCKAKIKVSSQPKVLGAATTAILPATGTPVIIILISIILGPIGYYLYKRFRLV
jgi:hypothetical protein